MADATQVSLAGLAFTIFLLVLFRRVVFTWTVTGVFVLANTIFVVSGILALPWLWSSLESWFVGFELFLLSPGALRRATIIQVGGIALVLAGYQTAQFVATGGRISMSAGSLLPRVRGRLGVSEFRLKCAVLAVLLVGWGYILANFSSFAHGVREGWLARRPDVILQARMESIDNYLYVLLVYNVAPFITVALWITSRLRQSPQLRVLATVAVGSTAIFLLLVFQKRPLIIFLLALLFAEYWVRITSGKTRVEAVPKRTLMQSIRRAVLLGAIGIAAFGVLMGLYYSSTMIGQDSQSSAETVWLLAQVALQRIFGRLSIPSVMYAEYFPAMEPHYGVSNIGALAAIRGGEVYRDSWEVFDYFSPADTRGSVAISALGDFYAAFGWSGWIIGALILGVVLNRLDASLRRLEPTGGNIVLVIYSFVFAFYLSQSSVAKSVVGYGGIFFVLCWSLVRRYGGPSAVRQDDNRSTTSSQVLPNAVC